MSKSFFKAFAGAIALTLLTLPTFKTVESAESSVCKAQPSSIARENARKRSLNVDRNVGYVIEEIRDGVYWATDANFSFAVVTTGEGAIVIDAPTSIGGKIEEIVASVTNEPITHVIYTHAHADHIGGATQLPGDVTYLASAGAAEELQQFSF